MWEYELFKLAVVAVVVVLAHQWYRRSRYSLTGKSQYQTCPRCTASLRWGERHCDVCQWPGGSPTADSSNAVQQALHRMLFRFRELGVLSNDNYRALLKAMQSTVAKEAEEKSVEAVPLEPAPPTENPAAVPLPLAEVERSHPAAPVTPAKPTADQPAPVRQKPEPTPPAVPEAVPEAVPVPARVERYTASRQAAQEEARTAPPPPPKPKRDWGRLFQAFLEKNNIMLGELVGGLLIVTCSIALVISFWAEIASRPLLKFGIFNGVSAALFAMGFYTDRRWKIHTTSHGVLIISILLVPLNFLAIAAFTSSSPPTDVLSVAGEALSLVVFSALTYFAARTVTPQSPLSITLCVMICSVMQLLIRRFAGVESSLGATYLLAAVPLGSFALAVLSSLRCSLLENAKKVGVATNHFILFGMGLFATLLPLALLLFMTGEVAVVLQRLAPLLVVLAAPAFATALFFWQRLDNNLPALRVAAGSIGVLGGAMFLASVGLSWPLPFALVATALANFAVWGAFAWFARMPRLNLLAAAFLAFAWIVSAAVGAEQLSWTVADAHAIADALFSAIGGQRLLPVIALFSAIAAGCWWAGAKTTARQWGVAAAAAMVVSLALLTIFGFGRVGDPPNAAWYFAFYAALSTAAAFLANNRHLSRTAAAIAAIAVLQTTVFRFGDGWLDTQAWTFAMLLYSTLAVAVSIAARLWKNFQTDEFRLGFTPAGLIAATMAAAMLVFVGWHLEYESLAIGFAWLALLWLALAWLMKETHLFIAFQLSLAAAAGVMVTAQLSEQAWFASGATRWVDPRFWQAQGVALALSAIAWRLSRLAVRWLSTSQKWAIDTDFSGTPWSTFDRVSGGMLFAMLLLMASYAIFPGMAQELSPSVESGGRIPVALSAFELPHVSSAHAGGTGSWLLLSAMAVLAGMGCWDRQSSTHFITIYLLGAAACLLAAAQFADQTASASALRWILGGYTMLVAIPIVTRQQLRPWLANLGVELNNPPKFLGTSLSQTGRTLVVATIALLYLAIAGFVVANTLRSGPPVLGADRMLMWTGTLAALGVTTWLVLTVLVLTRDSSSNAQQTARSVITKIGHHLIAIGLALPLFVNFAYLVASKLTQRPLVGPDPTSWFGELGNSLLYGTPLAMFALVLLAFAVREASSRFAFSFGLLVAGVATLVYLLELAAAGLSLDARAWIELAQLNATAMATVALGWWLALAWHYRANSDSAPRPLLLQVLAGLAVMLSAETLLAGCWGVFVGPTSLTWETSIAGVRGLISVTLSAAALWLATKPKKVTLSPMHVVGLTVLGVMLLTNGAVRFDSGSWQAYHTLLVASAAASWALVFLPANWRAPFGATFFAGVTTIFALRELATGMTPPQWPWWSIGGLLAVYGVLLRIALVRRTRWPMWVATPALAIAAQAWWRNVVPQQGAYGAVNFFDLNAIVLAIAAISSVLVELRFRSRTESESPQRFWLIGFHRFSVWLAIGCVLTGVVIELFTGGGTRGWDTYWWLGLAAIGVTFSAIFATLWDRNIRWPVVTSYTLSLAAVGKYLATLSLEGDNFTWAFTLALGSFVLATSYLWQRREAIAEFAIRFGAPGHLRERLDSQVWILATNGLAVIVVLALVTQIEFHHPLFGQRISAAYAVLACGLGLAFMAAGRVETQLRYLAIATGALFAVAFAWAWIPPDLQVANLHRLVAAGVALAAMLPIYGTLLVKVWRKTNPWVEAAQKSIPVLAVSAGALLAFTLTTEAWYFVNGQQIPLLWPAVLAVALAVVGLAASSLAAALIPGRDPLNLSERGRMSYVYATEVFVGLFFVHIRVTMPWLFTGWFTQYWPFVVMLIAFAGVGLSEWFARHKKNVLAEPLGNTGILLPLLPVIGYWSSAQTGQYSVLLIAVGALYTAMAVMRKSPTMMGLALLAFNGSLWTMLHSVEGLGLLRHPQFWLIPPVLCVLIGAELNRGRLTASTLSSVRYVCAVMIYAASTADIFINGVGSGLWLPMVLAALSLAGIFGGILMRVRAFLFLGMAFLCLSLFSVVWHAAVELERTWIWWVAGIVTGAAIIVLFGLFEKKRDQALVLVEQIKQWEP